LIVEKGQNGKWQKTEMRATFPDHLRHRHPVWLKATQKGPPELEKEEWAEEAIIIV
jgi:hypothetical protein